MDPELARLVLPALIGAGSAILVLVIKDIVLFEIREARVVRRQLLDRKLTKLYAPLAVALKGGKGTLDNIYSDTAIFERFVENMHLLSPRLYNLISEYSQLGDAVRPRQFRHSEGDKRIEITQQVLKIFPMEFEKLREQYQGGFWRTRLLWKKMKAFRERKRKNGDT